MLTGFAALKYGATLALMPFSFAYVPELLLQGGWFDIAYTTTLYALGCALLAMGIQGTLLFGPRYAPLPSRLLFGLGGGARSEEHTSELQSLMRISYAVFCLKKKKNNNNQTVHISAYNV